jgi:hypothetical protein
MTSNHASGFCTGRTNRRVTREWFIGPVVTWLHSQDDRIAGVAQSGSGGDVLLAGITSYAGVRAGMLGWFVKRSLWQAAFGGNPGSL